MDAKHKIDRLVLLVGNLGMIESELQKYEYEVAQSTAASSPGEVDIAAMIMEMFTAMNKSKTLFGEQADIIRELSQPVAQQMDAILAEYSDAQSIIEGELEKAVNKKGRKHISPELIERIDGNVSELVGHYNELRKTAITVYNCFAGAANFMTTDDPEK